MTLFMKKKPETPAPVQEPAKKAPPKRKRPFDHHVWFTGEEERKLQIRAEQTGLSTGVFIRKAALEPPIVVDPHKKEELAAIQQLTAELKFSPLRDPVLPYLPKKLSSMTACSIVF